MNRILWFIGGIIVAFVLVVGSAHCQGIPPTPTQLDKLYQRAAATFVSTEYEIEFSYTYGIDGTVSKISSSQEHWRNQVVLYDNTAGIVHTHPRNCDPKPSPNDINVARQNHIYVYVLSTWALWVATPEGEVKKVGDVRVKKHGHLEIK